MKEFVYSRPGYTGPVGSVEAMHVYRSRPFVAEVEFWDPVVRTLDTPWLLWVDDQHGTPSWELDALVEDLSSRGLEPFGVYSEAAMVCAAQTCIERYAGGLSRVDDIVLRKDGVPTCSALALAWTLVRLGLVNPPEGMCLAGRPLVPVAKTSTLVRGFDIKAEEQVMRLFQAWVR